MINRLFLFGFVASVLGTIQSAPAQSIFVEATSLTWFRSANQREFDYFSGPSDQLNPAEDFTFDFERGFRGRVGIQRGSWELEGVGTYMNKWHSTYTESAMTVNLDMNAPTGQFGHVNSISQAAIHNTDPGPSNELESLSGGVIVADVESNWMDYELNLNFVVPWATCIKVGMGARYGDLGESFNLSLDNTTLSNPTSQFDAGDWNSGVPGPNSGNNEQVVGASLVGGGIPVDGDMLDIDFDADVSNELIGVQMTTHVIFYERNWLMLDSSAKWGVFMNRMNATLVERYSDASSMPGVPDEAYGTRTYRDTKVRPAFLGNVSLTGTIKILDGLRIKAGYEVMFVSGVALAADQWQHVQADAFGRSRYEIDGSETIVIRGGIASIEALW